jgi:hypothetical protein
VLTPRVTVGAGCLRRRSEKPVDKRVAEYEKEKSREEKRPHNRSVYKLYDSVEAAPQPFDNLRDLLKRASHIARSCGLDGLQKIERDGEPFLDSRELQYWVNEIEIRERKYDGGFEEVVDRIVDDIEQQKLNP